MKKKPYNKTADFLLPLVGKPCNVWELYLENAYLGDKNVQDFHKYHVYALFKWNGSTDYTDLLKELSDLDSYRGDYIMYDGNYEMYIFELPEEFHYDYRQFLIGRYSCLSDEAKKLLLVNRSPQSSMKRILYKCSSLRSYWNKALADVDGKRELDIGESEVWPIVDIHAEIFDKSEFVPEIPKKKNSLTEFKREEPGL